MKELYAPNWNNVIPCVFKKASKYELNFVAWDITVEKMDLSWLRQIQVERLILYR